MLILTLPHFVLFYHFAPLSLVFALFFFFFHYPGSPDCVLSFLCLTPLFDGLYVFLFWWLLPAGLGAFGFCLSYPGWVCL